MFYIVLQLAVVLRNYFKKWVEVVLEIVIFVAILFSFLQKKVKYYK